jgi:RNA-directed DNA polymerase
MIRYNNLYDQVCARDNVFLAYLNAKKKKSQSWGVLEFEKDLDNNLECVYQDLMNETYKISEYRLTTVYEPKERQVYCLPFRDRVAQHAVMNVLKPIWDKVFIKFTYSGIKGRGIKGFSVDLKHGLKRDRNTQYCLKIDTRKFYPTIDHDIMKEIVRKKIKDARVLAFLDMYIESAPGMPIGNYLSQYMATLYFAYFDHWMKDVMKVKYYYRYCDDIVILAKNKPQVHYYRYRMEQYMRDNLKLQIKDNYQVFPVDARGIDVVGYVFFHTHVLLRKSIKKNFCRKAAALNKLDLDPKKYKQQLSPWNGWLKGCNGRHLMKKVLKYEKVF